MDHLRRDGHSLTKEPRRCGAPKALIKTRILTLSSVFFLSLMFPLNADADATFKYDTLGRLVEFCSTDQSKKTTYSYDATGNRTSEVTATSSCTVSNSAPNAVNEQHLYTQDLAGSIIGFDVTSNDTDANGHDLSVISASCTSSCTTDIVNAKDVRVSFTSNRTQYTINYTISDGHGGTDSATLTVLVETGFCFPFGIC